MKISLILAENFLLTTDPERINTGRATDNALILGAD